MSDEKSFSVCEEMLPHFRAVLKFCSTNRLFTYFRRRYSKKQIGDLNDTIKLRGKIRAAKLSISFYKLCLANRVSPKFISARISRSRARHSPSIERAFLNDEIDKINTLIWYTKRAYKRQWAKIRNFLSFYGLRQWAKIRNFLSFYGLFRFCLYLSEIDQRTENVTKETHDRNIQLLRRRRFCGMLSDKEQHILNLSDYSLSDTERFVLSDGLDLSLSSKNVNREEVFAEFEILYAQLARQNPISSNELSSLKAKLSDLAHAYCGTPVDLGDFNMHKEHFQAIQSLRCNEQILITKPDKGSGVVILKKSDYIKKMGSILEDKTKFLIMVGVHMHDNTTKNEHKLQKRLLDFANQNILARDVYDRVRPTGLQRPRMYGLPKTHKEDIPFRPILSMIGSSQHELAKWLAEILAPVPKLYSLHSVKDSFTFANFIQNCNLEPGKTFLCSFDISSLFTNVPLDETIEIGADALYRGHLDCPPIPEDTFRELMLIATRGMELSFNNKMYKQLDGVAMGSPLGPALANIFVGFHESRLFDSTDKPGDYFRFEDDTFAIFGSELDSDHFKGKLNLLHPALKFIVEKEQNNSLNFLDVLVEKDGTGFLTSIYRKPTLTRQYIRWNSFGPKTRKISLIKTLVHRALMICSKTTLGSELDKTKQLLIENVYPKTSCPVYLKLPWIGNVHQNLKIKSIKPLSFFYTL